MCVCVCVVCQRASKMSQRVYACVNAVCAFALVCVSVRGWTLLALEHQDVYACRCARTRVSGNARRMFVAKYAREKISVCWSVFWARSTTEDDVRVHPIKMFDGDNSTTNKGLFFSKQRIASNNRDQYYFTTVHSFHFTEISWHLLHTKTVSSHSFYHTFYTLGALSPFNLNDLKFIQP